MAWATIKDKEAVKRRVALGSLHWGLTTVLPHKALQKNSQLPYNFLHPKSIAWMAFDDHLTIFLPIPQQRKLRPGELKGWEDCAFEQNPLSKQSLVWVLPYVYM